MADATDRPTDRPGSNVHKLTIITNILLREFLAAAIYIILDRVWKPQGVRMPNLCAWTLQERERQCISLKRPFYHCKNDLTLT